MNVYCTIRVPQGAAAELDAPGVERFYAARDVSSLLSKVVIDPFADAVKRRTGYHDGNVPSAPVDTEVPVGTALFVVRAEARLKRATASDIVDYANHLFAEALDTAQAGKRRLGMHTIEGAPYLKARDLLDALTAKRDEQAVVGATLKITSEPEALHAQEFPVALGASYARLTPESVLTYRRASGALTVFEDAVKGFEKRLKERTGYGKGNIPAATEEHWEVIGDHAMRVLTVPYDSPSYQAMVDALINTPAPRKKLTGDLVRAVHGEAVPEVLALRTRDSEAYLSVLGLQRRMEELRAEHTERALRQNIEHYPHVRAVRAELATA